MRGRKNTVRLRLPIIILLLLTVLTFAAYADNSTKTSSSAAKDYGANTEIYVVSGQAGSDYKYYGAKNEPKAGVYFGRVSLGGVLGEDHYGSINSAGLAGESLVSQYYALGDAYGLEYWSYLFRQYIQDGSHGLLVQLNFEQEAADCKQATAGTYDAHLIADFQYLATLSVPVFMRIGGEMNIWSDMATPSDYIAAYRHIAALARKYAPNVALVFSPNYSGGYKIDMDSYYPGDAYVDWVGCSLYFNRYTLSGDTSRDKFYGVGNIYGDAMLNIQQTVNLSRMHKKPVMITECGSAWSINGKNVASFAAARVEKAYAYLTMVYPEIKGIVYSDTNFGRTDAMYQLTGQATMTAAYNKGVATNPTLLKSLTASAKYYTKASAYKGDWGGTMKLAAYTYTYTKPTATWYVDGAKKATVSEYPYSYTLKVGDLSPGKHTVKVTFSNGQTKSYTFTVHTDGWVASGDYWYYYEAGARVTGWKQLDGVWYYFKADYTMATGWVKVGESWYYFSDSGNMQTGWVKDTATEKWYYLCDTGAMKTGWAKVSGKWYYFGTSGVMQTGWLKDAATGKWYYFDTSGVMQTGWQTVSGKKYYFGTSGVMATGWRKLSDAWYYFGENGVLRTGWLQLDEKWYYLGTGGVMCTGWQAVSGNNYYFGDSGVMITGWKKLSDSWYYFGKTGAMRTGWLQLSDNWYYLDDDGVMCTGWLERGGKRYYLNASGVMTVGTLREGCTVYTFGENGALSKEESVHSFDTGEVTAEPGCETEGTIVYTCTRCGETGTEEIPATGHSDILVVTIPGADTDGYTTRICLVCGRQEQVEDSTVPPTEDESSGWVEKDGEMYYYNKDEALTGWVQIGDDRYLFDETGILQTGWIELEGRRFYFRETGELVIGELELDDVRYTFDENGILIAETAIP